jgi:predicted DNA-binding transcriptional regulator AlpA
MNIPADQQPIQPTADPDYLVPDRQVAKEMGISLMGIWRWTRDPDLKFPPAVQIRGRNFRSRRMLEAWKRQMIGRAIGTRAGEAA